MKVVRLNQGRTALFLGFECDSSRILQPGGLTSLLFINPSFSLSSGLSGTLNVYFYLCHLVTNVTDCHLFGYTKFNIPRKVVEKEFENLRLTMYGSVSCWCILLLNKLLHPIFVTPIIPFLEH